MEVKNSIFVKKEDVKVNNEPEVAEPSIKLVVKFKKLNDDAILPKYAHNGDMGMDLTAIDVEYDASIDCFIYHTGLAVEVPKGYGMILAPRSSNRKTEAYLANQIGIIDSGYRGEIMFSYKMRDRNVTKAPYEAGDRVGQFFIIPYPILEVVLVDELSDTDRGGGGFGSTGK